MDDLDTQVLRSALAWQQAGRRVLLVTVARTWGSSPRPPGSLMALRDDGATVGSVSGGCIEDALIEQVRQGADLCEDGRPQVVRYGISAEQAHQFGLPCGGTVELVLERVGPHSGLAELLERCQRRQACERVLDLGSGEVRLLPGQPGQVPVLDDTAMRVPFGPRHRLIVIGAGDLSRFLCSMALGLGFEVTVCDPREERHSGWDLAGVTLSREMPDDLVARLRPDARTAVVAVTHDPKLDDLALIDALQSGAFYVGAIGSRAHAAQRRARLAEHFGLSAAQLDALHGPAGLYIGSRTPAEIALSIMAEVVAARNGVLARSGASVAAGKGALPSDALSDSCPV